MGGGSNIEIREFLATIFGRERIDVSTELYFSGLYGTYLYGRVSAKLDIRTYIHTCTYTEESESL